MSTAENTTATAFATRCRIQGLDPFTGQRVAAPIDPLTIANELITLGDRATDERRDSTPYLDRAEALLNAEGTDATDLMVEALTWLAA